MFAVKPRGKACGLAKLAAVRDYARLHAIVGARTSGVPCALCGHGAFRTTARVVRMPLVDDADGSTEPHGPEALVFACTACGHVRLHLLQILEELAADEGNGVGR